VKIIDDIGLAIPTLYLPKAEVDPTRWAVIACDQFTSEPEYWQKVEKIVGDSPSTLHLTFPEVYLEKPGEAERIQAIQTSMQAYLKNGILEPREGLVYVERCVGGRIRKGMMACLDLEKYDYNRGSSSLVRATEGTIVDRLPPRMKVRQGAALEIPHILVLIDDADMTVIEPLGAAKGEFAKLYDFDLMLESGHLAGYAVDSGHEARVTAALRRLAAPEVFSAKYGVGSDIPVLLFAMGDGNHSLATAKAVWEKIKAQAGMDHPARFALVEIENVHDPGLEFEPIHRALFGLKSDLFEALESEFGSNFSFTTVSEAGEMVEQVDSAVGEDQLIGLVGGRGGVEFGVIRIANPLSNLAVGTLQSFLDRFLKDGGAEKIDYVHGREVVVRLGLQSGNAGFYLPGMEKSDLFKTVILDGALPRKTFSMGEAREKRFYMEARKIA
jgi:hypothetical protein